MFHTPELKQEGEAETETNTMKSNQMCGENIGHQCICITTQDIFLKLLPAPEMTFCFR